MSEMPEQANKKPDSPTGTDEAGLLEQLEKAAEAVGVAIRYDKLATGDIKSTSGACKIRGIDTIILDRRLGTRERIAALARELSRFNFDQVFLPPAVRSLVEAGRVDTGEANTHEKT